MKKQKLNETKSTMKKQGLNSRKKGPIVYSVLATGAVAGLAGTVAYFATHKNNSTKIVNSGEKDPSKVDNSNTNKQLQLDNEQLRINALKPSLVEVKVSEIPSYSKKIITNDISDLFGIPFSSFKDEYIYKLTKVGKTIKDEKVIFSIEVLDKNGTMKAEPEPASISVDVMGFDQLQLNFEQARINKATASLIVDSSHLDGVLYTDSDSVHLASQKDQILDEALIKIYGLKSNIAITPKINEATLFSEVESPVELTLDSKYVYKASFSRQNSDGNFEMKIKVTGKSRLDGTTSLKDGNAVNINAQVVGIDKQQAIKDLIIEQERINEVSNNKNLTSYLPLMEYSAKTNVLLDRTLLGELFAQDLDNQSHLGPATTNLNRLPEVEKQFGLNLTKYKYTLTTTGINKNGLMPFSIHVTDKTTIDPAQPSAPLGVTQSVVLPVDQTVTINGIGQERIRVANSIASRAFDATPQLESAHLGEIKIDSIASTVIAESDLNKKTIIQKMLDYIGVGTISSSDVGILDFASNQIESAIASNSVKPTFSFKLETIGTTLNGSVPIAGTYPKKPDSNASDKDLEDYQTAIIEYNNNLNSGWEKFIAANSVSTKSLNSDGYSLFTFVSTVNGIDVKKRVVIHFTGLSLEKEQRALADEQKRANNITSVAAKHDEASLPMVSNYTLLTNELIAKYGIRDPKDSTKAFTMNPLYTYKFKTEVDHYANVKALLNKYTENVVGSLTANGFIKFEIEVKNKARPMIIAQETTTEFDTTNYVPAISSIIYPSSISFKMNGLDEKKAIFDLNKAQAQVNSLSPSIEVNATSLQGWIESLESRQNITTPNITNNFGWFTSNDMVKMGLTFDNNFNINSFVVGSISTPKTRLSKYSYKIDLTSPIVFTKDGTIDLKIIVGILDPSTGDAVFPDSVNPAPITFHVTGISKTRALAAKQTSINTALASITINKFIDTDSIDEISSWTKLTQDVIDSYGLTDALNTLVDINPIGDFTYEYKLINTDNPGSNLTVNGNISLSIRVSSNTILPNPKMQTVSSQNSATITVTGVTERNEINKKQKEINDNAKIVELTWDDESFPFVEDYEEFTQEQAKKFNINWDFNNDFLYKYKTDKGVSFDSEVRISIVAYKPLFTKEVISPVPYVLNITGIDAYNKLHNVPGIKMGIWEKNLLDTYNASERHGKFSTQEYSIGDSLDADTLKRLTGSDKFTPNDNIVGDYIDDMKDTPNFQLIGHITNKTSDHLDINLMATYTLNGSVSSKTVNVKIQGFKDKFKPEYKTQGQGLEDKVTSVKNDLNWSYETVTKNLVNQASSGNHVISIETVGVRKFDNEPLTEDINQYLGLGININPVFNYFVTTPNHVSSSGVVPVTVNVNHKYKQGYDKVAVISTYFNQKTVKFFTNNRIFLHKTEGSQVDINDFAISDLPLTIASKVHVDPDTIEIKSGIKEDTSPLDFFTKTVLTVGFKNPKNGNDFKVEINSFESSDIKYEHELQGYSYYGRSAGDVISAAEFNGYIPSPDDRLSKLPEGYSYSITALSNRDVNTLTMSPKFEVVISAPNGIDQKTINVTLHGMTTAYDQEFKGLYTRDNIHFYTSVRNIPEDQRYFDLQGHIAIGPDWRATPSMEHFNGRTYADFKKAFIGVYLNSNGYNGVSTGHEAGMGLFFGDTPDTPETSDTKNTGVDTYHRVFTKNGWVSLGSQTQWADGAHKVDAMYFNWDHFYKGNYDEMMDASNVWLALVDGEGWTRNSKSRTHLFRQYITMVYNFKFPPDNKAGAAIVGYHPATELPTSQTAYINGVAHYKDVDQPAFGSEQISIVNPVKGESFPSYFEPITGLEKPTVVVPSYKETEEEALDLSIDGIYKH